MGRKTESATQSTCVLEHVESWLTKRGLASAEIVATAGIDPNLVCVPNTFIPLVKFVRLLEAAAEAAGDDLLGLAIGASVPPGVYGLADYVVLQAPSVQIGLDNFVKYRVLGCTGYDARLERVRGHCHLVIETSPVLGAHTQFLDFLVGVATSRIQRLTGPKAPGLVFDLERGAPENGDGLAHLQQLLGSKVRLRRKLTRIGVPSSVLPMPVIGADDMLYRIVLEAADRAMGERQQTGDFTARLTAHLSETLRHGHVSLAVAAKSLSMSQRTLQRELARRGTSFHDVLDRTRKAMAQRYITDTDTPLTEIAFLLGFSELSAFSRAAKTWFGSSPSAMRANRRARRGRASK